MNISFKSKYSYLAKFYFDLDEFSRLKTQKQNTKEKKMYVKQLQNYVMNSQEYSLMNTMIYWRLEEKNMDSKYDPANLTLSTYDYEKWYNEESDN